MDWNNNIGNNQIFLSYQIFVFRQEQSLQPIETLLELTVILLSLFSKTLLPFEWTHHLWYLQVSAPLTSSVMAAESLMSSMITTSGSSPPLSLSIWFARLDRYDCKSCNRKQRRINYIYCEITFRIFWWNSWALRYLLRLTMHVESDSGAATHHTGLMVGLG